MNHDAAHGSQAYLFFVAEVALIIILLVRDWLMPRSEHTAAVDVTSGTPASPVLSLGDDVLIDISARYNEAVVSNIDAIDTALIAMLALPVAFAVFAIDKIAELPHNFSAFAITFLLASGLASFVGYLWGYVIRSGRNGIQDGIVPRRFLADYTQRGALAVADAIRAVNAAGELNAQIRLVKRTFAAGSLVYFLTGTAVVVVARLAGFHQGP